MSIEEFKTTCRAYFPHCEFVQKGSLESINKLVTHIKGLGTLEVTVTPGIWFLSKSKIPKYLEGEILVPESVLVNKLKEYKKMVYG